MTQQTETKKISREAAIKRLFEKIRNPERWSVSGYPVVIFKDGRHFEIMPHLGGYIVSRDFGCTCREVGRAKHIDPLFDLLMAQARSES